MNSGAGNLIVLATVVLLGLAGCVSRSEARKSAAAAYQAGQREALLELYERKFAVVTVLGPVRVPKLDWTEDLTLAQAIVAADYQRATVPRQIIIRRGAEQFSIDPQQLLNGTDWPLQPGDQIEILP
ncbi:MAG: hypothetical protein BWX84_02890 [Verrucomicrobia bacterium ADurb.Bin118]|jgi:hypothetical protein|nr:hypothetical protein [Verrucomicrobiota bacterium]OQB88601.1 MAG: hypothetical protein BWX84_02890 [Verrucomicrobia bacterium ADurb.Bin118]